MSGYSYDNLNKHVRLEVEDLVIRTLKRPTSTKYSLHNTSSLVNLIYNKKVNTYEHISNIVFSNILSNSN